MKDVYKDEQVKELTFRLNEQLKENDQLKAENAELKSDMKTSRDAKTALLELCKDYKVEIRLLKARVAELEQENSVLKLQLETYCDDCDELIR